ALTRILCDQRWRIAPEFHQAAPELADMLRSADAALVIGDPALRIAITAEGNAQRGSDEEIICDGKAVGLPEISQLHIYDVVQEWRNLTQRPAVLGVWAA